MNIKPTVFFEDPFWVGVFERMEDGMLETSRVVFGHEPKDHEVYSHVLENYFRLRFSRPVHVCERAETKKINSKRLQRVVRKETGGKGVGTKAQQVMKQEYEAMKQEKKKGVEGKKRRAGKDSFREAAGKKEGEEKRALTGKTVYMVYMTGVYDWLAD